MKNKSAGFTLVELMVVVVVLGLVALIASQIPLFSLSSWTKGSERLKLQRDAYYAMFMVQRQLRPARVSRIEVLPPYTLIVDQGTGKRFFFEGNKLFYYNDAGSEELVIEGEAGTQFDVSRDGNTVKINLTLTRGNVDITLTTVVEPRN